MIKSKQIYGVDISKDVFDVVDSNGKHFQVVYKSIQVILLTSRLFQIKIEGSSRIKQILL